MALLNAHDDFVQRSLSAFRNIWEKLNYVAGLRTPSAVYEHWGLARIHGQNQAHEAISTVHTELFIESLATPISQLSRMKAGSEGSKELASRDLTPLQLGGGCRQHMDYVVEALTCLSQESAPTSHLAA